VIERCSDGLWRSGLLAREEWLEHCFGTAVSSPGGPYLFLKQIHSTLTVDAACWTPDLEADALMSSAPGVAVAVKTADCVPILLADPVRRVVAAVHAGWRGTAGRIAEIAAGELQRRYGSDPCDLLAAFGPSIGPCCFEVGPDVAPLFQPLFPERRDLDRQTKVDLREANSRVLAQAGVVSSRIDRDNAPCTFCGGAEFHSWRRDRERDARMYSTISLRSRQPYRE
jgi:hypothetical protein